MSQNETEHPDGTEESELEALKTLCRQQADELTQLREQSQTAPAKTAAARHRPDGRAALDAAAQAARSGGRTELQAYLRLRRQYV